MDQEGKEQLKKEPKAEVEEEEEVQEGEGRRRNKKRGGYDWSVSSDLEPPDGVE